MREGIFCPGGCCSSLLVRKLPSFQCIFHYWGWMPQPQPASTSLMDSVSPPPTGGVPSHFSPSVFSSQGTGGSHCVPPSFLWARSPLGCSAPVVMERVTGRHRNSNNINHLFLLGEARAVGQTKRLRGNQSRTPVMKGREHTPLWLPCWTRQVRQLTLIEGPCSSLSLYRHSVPLKYPFWNLQHYPPPKYQLHHSSVAISFQSLLWKGTEKVFSISRALM